MLPGAKGFRRGYFGYIHIYGHTDIQIEICSNSKVKATQLHCSKMCIAVIQSDEDKKKLLYCIMCPLVGFLQKGGNQDLSK